MRMTLLCAMLALAVWTTTAQAGYRNLGKGERPVNHAAPAVQDERTWEATLIREDGTALALKNLGDRFASVTLKRGEIVHICLKMPGIKAEAVVNVSAIHGGRIDGGERAQVVDGGKDERCFTFTMGTMGAHPLRIAAGGRAKSMVFLTEPVSRGPITTTGPRGDAGDE